MPVPVLCNTLVAGAKITVVVWVSCLVSLDLVPGPWGSLQGTCTAPQPTPYLYVLPCTR